MLDCTRIPKSSVVKALVFLLGLMGAARLAVAAEPQVLVLATGPVAGVNYPVGGALCRTINIDGPRLGLRCLIESTSGSRENLGRLAAGDFDLALLQSDWQYYAPSRLAQASNSGDSDQSEGGPEATGLRAVMALHAQPFTLVAGADSGIASLADLDGKKLNLGPKGSAVRASAIAFLEALGWSEEDWQDAPDLSPAALVDAVCTGSIDAFLLPISHPNGLVGAVTDRCQAKLVPIDGQAAEVLVQSWPFYTRVEIPGGVYNDSPDPVPSFGLRTTLVASETLSPDVVYDLVRTLFEGYQDFLTQHGALARLKLDESALAGNTLPFHEGAARFYRERGWLEPESQ